MKSLKKDFENIATGTLAMNEIEFMFVFDRQELRLIPPTEKTREVEMWFYEEFKSGSYVLGQAVYVKEKFLVGKCDDGYEIVFFPIEGKTIRRNGEVLIISIQAYLWKYLKIERICKIGFESPEIDCIFSTRQAVESMIYTNTGKLKIETKPFVESKTQKQVFAVEGKEVSVSFRISQNISGDLTKPPLALHSEMCFEFDEIEDYSFVFQLYRIAKLFVQYLCYRKNVPFSSVNIAGPCENGKYIQCANLFVMEELVETEMDCLKDGRYIIQEYISGVEGKILGDIAEGLLYTRNIPNTYIQGRSIDAARFVMITAAFEWEFRRLYPNGIEKKQRTIDAEDVVEAVIEELRSKSTGKVKDICKNLLNGIRSTPLSSRVIHTGKNLGGIIDIFGKHLYRINNQELKYSDMGLRLSKQRNNYAHGNLDQEFVGLALLDLIYLEMIIYAMQLKFYGINELKIKKAINDLFHRNFIIEDEAD